MKCGYKDNCKDRANCEIDRGKPLTTGLLKCQREHDLREKENKFLTPKIN